MNHFTDEENDDIDLSFLGDFSSAEFVLDALFFAGVDYQSAICRRYFEKVLKQIAHIDCLTYIGIDNGFILCVNEPIADVVELLGG